MSNNKLNTNHLTPEALYTQLSENLRTSDEISFKLLSLVPLTTLLTFIGILIKEDTITWSPLFYCFGVFGAILIWGIFRWELRNIQRCVWYCELIDKMEAQVDKDIPDMKKKYPRPSFFKWKMGKTESEKVIYTVLILAWLAFPVIIKGLKVGAFQNMGWFDWTYYGIAILIIIMTIKSCTLNLKKG